MIDLIKIRSGLKTMVAHPDANKQQKGQSEGVRRIIALNIHHFDENRVIVAVVAPIVDAIGRVEQQNVTIADCLLEILRLYRLCLEHDGAWAREEFPDIPWAEEFVIHMHNSFRYRFTKHFDLPIYWLSLFLHPLCRDLVVCRKIKSKSLNELISIALELAQRFQLDRESTIQLAENLREYHARRFPFDAQLNLQDGAAYWEHLPKSEERYPLKALVCLLFRLVPHSGDVLRGS